MDEYLSSLVKKGAEVDEAISEVPEEIITDAASKEKKDYEEPSIEEVVEEKSTDEESVKEEPSLTETKSVEDKKEVNKKETKKPEKKETKKPEKKSDSILVEGNEYDILPARVYRSPDLHQPSALISGKVIFLGKEGTFSIVKYMKHGFGLVKGYINELEQYLKED